MKEYDKYGESAFPGYGSALFNSDYEIRKLKKENVDLQMELEILKNSRPSRNKRMCKVQVSKEEPKTIQHSEGLQNSKNLTFGNL